MPYSSPLPLLPPLPPQSPVSPSSFSTNEQELSDSFILVANDEDVETESTSTISTALLAELSDTSSEPRYAGSLEGSFHGELSEADDDLDLDSRSDSVRHEADYELGGSYADAEATASLITESRSTLSPRSLDPSDWSPPGSARPRPTMDRAASSQFRFIFPSPEASFSSNAAQSDGTTPTGSLAELLPPPKLPGDRPTQLRLSATALPIADKREASSRGVDEDWLKDARTWVSELRPITPSESDKRDLWPEEGYAPLASSAGTVGDKDETSGGQADGVKMRKQTRIARGRRELPHALRAMVAVGVDTANRRWGVIAVASCALAILSAIGPTMNYLSTNRHSDRAINATTPSMHMHTAPPLAVIASGLPLVATPSARSLASSTTKPSVSIATQLISDLQLIRNAISTFTLIPNKHEPIAAQGVEVSAVDGLTAPKSASNRVRRPEEAISFGKTPYCAEATRPSNAALTAPASANVALSVFDDSGYKAWMRAMANKVLQPTTPSPPLDFTRETNSSADSRDCATSTSTRIENHYAYLVLRAQDYAAATVSALGQLYQPMLRHLDYELGELYRLTAAIANANTTHFIVHSLHTASRGARNALRSIMEVHDRRKAHDLAQLRLLQQYVIAKWTNITLWAMAKEQAVAQDAIQRARQGLGRFSEYAEDRKAELRAEGERSIRQAKKGLNQLLHKPKDGAAPIDAKGSSTRTQPPSDQHLPDHRTPENFAGQRFYRTGRVPRERRSRNERRQHQRQRGTPHRLGHTPSKLELQRPAQDNPGNVHGARPAPAAPGRIRRRWRSLVQAIHHGAVQVVLHQV